MITNVNQRTHRFPTLSYVTMPLTLANGYGTISLDNKRVHERGKSKAVYLFSGMDTARKEEAKRRNVSLCGQMDRRQNQVALHRTGCQDRSYFGARDTGETQQSGVKPQKRTDPPSGSNRKGGP